MAVNKNENVPKSMFGVQGFNVWNILMLAIVLAWLVNRRREGLTWDMPQYMSVLLQQMNTMLLPVIGFVRTGTECLCNAMLFRWL